jgi:hypothetical protein
VVAFHISAVFKSQNDLTIGVRGRFQF